MHRLKIVALALVALLMLPAGAYAEENSLAGSFVSGLTDTVSPQVEKPVDVGSEIESAGEVRATAESDDSPTGAVQSWITSLRLTYGNATFGPDGWYRMARSLLINVVLPLAVLLVFFWWGLRKGLRMLFAAFRKGKANV